MLWSWAIWNATLPPCQSHRPNWVTQCGRQTHGYQCLVLSYFEVHTGFHFFITLTLGMASRLSPGKAGRILPCLRISFLAPCPPSLSTLATVNADPLFIDSSHKRWPGYLARRLSSQLPSMDPLICVCVSISPSVKSEKCLFPSPALVPKQSESNRWSS